jgi:hypothetical protein
MQLIFFALYVVIGFAQLFAIMDWFGWGGLFGFLGAAFLAYIPIVGSVIGVLGAHEVWHWSWLASLLLFFWYVPLVGLAMIFDRS